MSTVYTNETNLSFWLRLCRARSFAPFVVRVLLKFAQAATNFKHSSTKRTKEEYIHDALACWLDDLETS